jgi:hypothetical protein
MSQSARGSGEQAQMKPGDQVITPKSPTRDSLLQSAFHIAAVCTRQRLFSGFEPDNPCLMRPCGRARLLLLPPQWFAPPLSLDLNKITTLHLLNEDSLLSQRSS